MPRRLLSSLLVASLALAGCGGDDSEEGAPSTTAPDGEDDLDTTTSSSPSTSATDETTGPPTTRGPAPDLVVDPLGNVGGITVLSGEPPYRGVLGQVDPDRNIVAAVALALLLLALLLILQA